MFSGNDFLLWLYKDILRRRQRHSKYTKQFKFQDFLIIFFFLRKRQLSTKELAETWVTQNKDEWFLPDNMNVVQTSTGFRFRIQGRGLQKGLIRKDKILESVSCSSLGTRNAGRHQEQKDKWTDSCNSLFPGDWGLWLRRKPQGEWNVHLWLVV